MESRSKVQPLDLVDVLLRVGGYIRLDRDLFFESGYSICSEVAHSGTKCMWRQPPAGQNARLTSHDKPPPLSVHKQTRSADRSIIATLVVYPR